MEKRNSNYYYFFLTNMLFMWEHDQHILKSRQFRRKNNKNMWNKHIIENSAQLLRFDYYMISNSDSIVDFKLKFIFWIIILLLVCLCVRIICLYFRCICSMLCVPFNFSFAHLFHQINMFNVLNLIRIDCIVFAIVCEKRCISSQEELFYSINISMILAMLPTINKCIEWLK